jgi:Spx/MgsR family transcriptional regulator
MVTLYGIANCDTIKKARRWLEARDIEYRFHDYRKQGLPEDVLRRWVAELGWDELLNRRGMMWRKLPAETRDAIDAENAVRIMLETPSIIRRPLLDTGNSRRLGFTEAMYEEIFR